MNQQFKKAWDARLEDRIMQHLLFLPTYKMRCIVGWAAFAIVGMAVGLMIRAILQAFGIDLPPIQVFTYRIGG